MSFFIGSFDFDTYFGNSSKTGKFEFDFDLDLDIDLEAIPTLPGPYPENNDGRETCAWCGAPTREVPGFNVTDVYNICTECER